jgi:hypothetical protein
MEARVIRIDDGPIAAWSEADVLPRGQVGEIAVRGPVVTHAYHNLPEPTAAAKIADGEAVWHRMGDLGYFDEGGRLWFCGRKAERVETAAGPWFTDKMQASSSQPRRVAPGQPFGRLWSPRSPWRPRVVRWVASPPALRVWSAWCWASG